MEALEDGAMVNMKAGLTLQLPDKSRTPHWTNQSMGWTAPGLGHVNHNLIYAKQENKLCLCRSISHPF